MEETTVVIVGAGPSGLALGALLGRMNVKVRRVASARDDSGTAATTRTDRAPDHNT